MAGVQVLGQVRRRRERVRVQPGGGGVPPRHRAQFGELEPFAGRGLLLPTQEGGQALLQRQQALAAPQLGGQVLANLAGRPRLAPKATPGQ